MKLLITVSSLLLLSAANLCAQTIPAAGYPLTTATTDSTTSSTRNIILIIGDGMDDTQVTIGRNYLKGAMGRLLLDQMPHRGSVQVLSVDERQPEQPLYVADSANSATAIATGTVTSRGRIATTAGTDQDLTTIAELAKAAGFATGVVTTASVTDATPAAFVAHTGVRSCHDPLVMLTAKPLVGSVSVCKADMKTAGGKGSIAEQIADSDMDVVLGGGKQHFVVAAEHTSELLTDVAAANNYQLITTAEQLNTVPTTKKMLGLFADSTLPVRMRGENGRYSEPIKVIKSTKTNGRTKTAVLPKPMQCETNPEFAGTPHLRDMTSTALTHLQARSSKGFFLMVESASIDKQSHERKPCGQIGEMAQLEEALQVALTFAAQHPQTLVLVTADHGQAAQIIADGSLFKDSGVDVFSPGLISRIITPEGSIMAVNYATSQHDFPMEEHTGTSVPLYSNQPVPPMLAQPQLFELMRHYLQLAPASRSNLIATRK